MNPDNKRDLIACAAVLQCAWSLRQGGVSGTQAVVVSIEGGDENHARVYLEGSEPQPSQIVAGSRVRIEGGLGEDGGGWVRSYDVLSSGLGPERIFEARCQSSGEPLAVQVLERRALGWSLSAWGTIFEVLARPPRFAELSTHMKPPPRSALDDALLSPMPGTLIEVKVAEGDTVHIGQQLCVIEAMKMQNVLTATRDGVVETLMAQPGSTLAAEQPIMAFAAPAA